MFCDAEVARSVVVNVVWKPAVMSGSCHVAHMEGVFLVASRDGCGCPDRPESAAEGVAGANKMSMVHAKG